MNKLRQKIEQKLYEWAMKSPVRKWSLSLTGWKWWAWQLVVGMFFFCIVETLLNKMAAKVEDRPCVSNVEHGGSGHIV